MTSKHAINKATTHTVNPQTPLDFQTTLHIQRMQSLLEEYHCQNSFLNQQIIELLDNKSKIGAKSKNIISNKVNEKNGKYSLFHEGDKVYENLVKKPSQSRNSSNKKKYEYVDKAETFIPIASAYNPYQNSSSKKYQYSQHTTAPSKKIHSKYPTSNFSLQIKNQYAKPLIYGDQPVSPEITSRFLNEKQIKNQTTAEKVRKQANYDEAEDVLPILKRDADIGQSIIKGSIQNSPNMSSLDRSQNKNCSSPIKSTTKSRIRAISSEKDSQKQTNHLVSPNKSQSIRQESKSKQPSPSKQTKRVSFIEQENYKRQLALKAEQNKQQSERQIIQKERELFEKQRQTHKQNSTKNEIKTINNLILIDRPEIKRYPHFIQSQKPLIIYSQVGVNTQPSSNVKPTTSLFRDRSLSQHRIVPSEKIIYSSESVQISRKGSQSSFRGQSKQKRKFINIVSSTLVAKKLGK